MNLDAVSWTEFVQPVRNIFRGSVSDSFGERRIRDQKLHLIWGPKGRVVHHEPEEFEAAMAALTAIDLVRLRKAQRILARPPLADADDLLQETFLRVRLGTRHWPQGVSALSFAIGVMKSLADEAVKRLSRETLDISSGVRRSGTPLLSSTATINRNGVAHAYAEGLTPEDDLTASEQLEELKNWRAQTQEALAGDDDGQLMLEGMFDGLKGRELQSLTDLDDRAFATKQKLVRRRLEKITQAKQEREKRA